jgi:hypothetical protein
VQKLGEPLPDIQDIVRHVSQTVGTSAFGVPRVPDGHHPRHPPVVYLKQIWPQILPVAQRFCRKPMQVPVLFGIALQRAIEHTKDMLSPTLSASIAMECAVAMARVALPETHHPNPPVISRMTVATEMYATSGPMASPAHGKSAEPTLIRATRARKRKSAGDAEADAPGIGALVARVPPAARIVTIAALAFMTVAGAMYSGDPREERDTARGARELTIPNVRASTPVLALDTQDTSSEGFQSAPEAQASEERQSAEEVAAPAVTSEAPADDSLNEYPQLPPQPSSDGSEEGLMRDEFGQPMK